MTLRRTRIGTAIFLTVAWGMSSGPRALGAVSILPLDFRLGSQVSIVEGGTWALGPTACYAPSLGIGPVFSFYPFGGLYAMRGRTDISLGRYNAKSHVFVPEVGGMVRLTLFQRIIVEAGSGVEFWMKESRNPQFAALGMGFAIDKWVLKDLVVNYRPFWFSQNEIYHEFRASFGISLLGKAGKK